MIHLSIRGGSFAQDLLNIGISGLCDVTILNFGAPSRYILPRCLWIQKTKKMQCSSMEELRSEDSDSDEDQGTEFIKESLRHLTIGKINVNRVSDYEKTMLL